MSGVADLISIPQVLAITPVSDFLSLILTALSTISPTRLKYPKQTTVYDGQQFDFIIVGGGTAGCVVANRLTEIDNWTVLLIEAGGDPTIDAEIPGFVPFTQYGTKDWGYHSVNDGYSCQAHKTNNVHMARAKMLGGCSSNNLLYYVRGNKADYEYWVALGNDGWDWDTVLRYFKKSERLDVGSILNSDSASLHNTNGYLGITQPDWGDKLKPYFEAFKENGHEILVDTNGYQQLGFSAPVNTVYNHIRQSTAAAFLSPIKDRPNVYVLKNTLVTKLILSKSKVAVGVEAKLSNGKIIQLKAKNEIILSAGSINSPQLLMLSGIGPKEHLDEMNIDVILDSPKVGQNLQDHAEVFINLSGKKGITRIINNIQLLTNLDKVGSPNLIGHVTLNQSQTFPDYQVIVFLFPPSSPFLPALCSTLNELEDNICLAIINAGQDVETLTTALSLLHPESRGHVKLQSKDPEEKPLIYLGYYSNDKDLEKHARCIEDYVTIVNTTFFKSFDSKIVDFEIEQCRNYTFASHEYWKCFALNTAMTIYHPVGTCAMGPEGVGVVDERLRVRGVKNLRVVDGSIMPTITSGNTNAPIIMIAEKASDMIKADNGVIL